MNKTVKAFLEAVYPEAVDLARECFDETIVLRDATKTIKELKDALTLATEVIATLDEIITELKKDLEDMTADQILLIDAVDEVEALDRNITGSGINFGEQMNKWTAAHKVMYQVRYELRREKNEK